MKHKTEERRCTDHFTACVKLSPHEVLPQHVVDVQKVVADFREASERRQASSSQTHGANKHFFYSITCARGKEDAFEKQIAEKWHIITLQEASEHVEHEILHERFHVTHFAGCAILFNKDTFYPDSSAKSIYLHDTRRGVQDHIVEGEQGWVLQGVLSRASFRRAAASGQKVFIVSSLHISNIYAKKKGTAKKINQTIRAIMISQDIDLVAGDFNGTAWRCRSRDNISTIDEVFSDCALPTPPGPTPLWGPGSIPNNWADVCGFRKPPGSQRFLEGEQTWRLFQSSTSSLGLRPSDQSCHHETWLHLHFVDWNTKWNHKTHYDRNISLKERPASSGNRAQKRSISEILSDHSLSS